MKLNWLAIANPGAGAFRFGRFRDAWMPELERHFARMVYTEAAGHATQVARASGAFDGIAVIGGDGTLFEVLAGRSRPDQPLGLIPAGRGNCLAMDLGLTGVREALAAITAGESVSVDLMAVEAAFDGGGSREFVAASTVAVGYVAAVVRNAARFSRLGHYAYTPAAVLTWPRRSGMQVQYGMEPALRAELTGIVVNNTRYLANFLAFPQASLSDGCLDVLESRVGWARQCLHDASILSGRDFYDPARHSRQSRLHIRMDRPDILMVDGELFESVRELSVRCLPCAALLRRSVAR